ncbi:DUF5723 family protein [uncultured Winogradskyella sp.]|uniref:DUF5723 family protein n=1 Tax=uncultured Winogradskyella sp. TaxID=395353 RepID=UPI0026335D8F|nr:DUF5723 family protein [uncultured Winogradskyella sp.]
MHYSFTQNKQLLFGFNDIPQSVMVNPSTTLDNNWFVGFPLLSHFHVNFGSSGMSAFDLFADDGRDFNSKLQSLIFRLDDNDFFTATQSLDVFSGGFAFGKGIEKDRYLSFGMYIETDVIAYYPKDYAILAYEGNASNIGRVFDLSDLNVRGEVVSVFHVGITKKVNNKLTVGARGKIYSSIFNINSTENRGTFTTQVGQNNLLSHTFNLDLSVNTSGIGSLIDDDNSDISNDIKTLRRRLLFGGNLGLGLDFGFTYEASEQLVFEGSLLDFGFIRHNKDLENYSLSGSYVYEGINPLFPEMPDGQTAEDYWDEVADNFEELFEVDSTKTKYTTWRPVKLNAAVRYKFGKKNSKDCNCLAEDGGYLNAVGAQLYAIKRPKAPQLALTAFYYRRVFNDLSVKATYTIDSFSFTNMGFGLSTDIGPLNFYLLADNLLEYQNIAKAQSASLQFGLNLVFGKGQKQ